MSATSTATPTGARPRIVIVDDEERVLTGLRNLFRRDRHRWQVDFALGGPAALALMEQAPVDVVVSDMRMPGMDGAELLEAVQQRHPEVMRLVLTGHAEPDALIRALPVAHQILSKPCPADTLRGVLERVCGLRATFGSPAVHAACGGVSALPPAPRMFNQLRTRLGDPLATLQRLSSAVSEDPATAARVLQLANSAYIGGGTPVDSVQQAVQRVGVELLRAVVFSVGAFASFGGDPRTRAVLDELQRASVLTARIAQRIVTDPDARESALSAGVVHDIGRATLACRSPDALEEIDARARAEGRPTREVEQEVLGTTHGPIGAYLLGAWGLPVGIVEAVAYHSAPSLSPAPLSPVTIAVHVAEQLTSADASLGRLDPIVAALPHVRASWPEWQALVEEERSRMVAP